MFVLPREWLNVLGLTWINFLQRKQPSSASAWNTTQASVIWNTYKILWISWDFNCHTPERWVDVFTRTFAGGIRWSSSHCRTRGYLARRFQVDSVEIASKVVFFCVLASLSCLCLLCLLLLLLLHMTRGSWDLKQTELMGIRFPVCLNGPQQLLQFSIIFLQNISINQTV